MTFFRTLLVPAIISIGAAGAAHAELTFCNDTDKVQSLSIGYDGPQGWTSEGWWNIEPGECTTPIKDDLTGDFYYFRAEQSAGPFKGGGFMFCTDSKAYTIVGDSDCEGRGYVAEDFAEIATGGAKSLVHRLTPEDMARAQAAEGLGLQFCNDTAETHAVSIGYPGSDGLTSEGWWNVEPGQCVTPIKDALRFDTYYYRTEVAGGPFQGDGVTLCTTPQAYTIEGNQDCAARGYDAEDFAVLKVGDAKGHTHRIGGADRAADTGSPTDGAVQGLQFCNRTEYEQSVSVGYEGPEDWTSEGWWNVPPGECQVTLTDLAKRYYYYRAEIGGGDFDHGTYFFCTSPKAYTIVGDSDCEARGFDRENFAEIDIGAGAASGYSLDLTPENSGTPVGMGLTVCNDAAALASVAIGYEGDNGWRSEGWTNIEPGACARVLSEPLERRYYYYRAEIGGRFDGNEELTFCTSPQGFEIEGYDKCAERGFESETFREIDTGENARAYMLRIAPTEAGASGTGTGTGTGTDTTGAGEEVTETGPNAVTASETPPETPPETPRQTSPATAAKAGFQVCNQTEQRQSLSFGYEGSGGWTSEGWWVVDPRDCTAPELDGQRHRYIYYRAEVGGGDFTGQSYFFCTTPDAYTIVGDSDCEARGYAREDFRELDIGADAGEPFTLALTAETGGIVPADSGGPAMDTPATVPDNTGPADTGTDTGTETGTETGTGADMADEPASDPSARDEPAIDMPANPRRGKSR